MEDFNIIEIQGKNGKIRLHVPKREASKEEIDDLYKSVAEVIVNINKVANNKGVNNNCKKAASK
jgi:hypothetical protein